MDRRNQHRIATRLPVRIWGVDANCRAFMQLANVRNVSDSGVLLDGVRCHLKPGEVVDIQYNSQKAEFVVIWCGKPGSRRAGELGLQALPEQPCIWDTYLDRACEFVGKG